MRVRNSCLKKERKIEKKERRKKMDKKTIKVRWIYG